MSFHLASHITLNLNLGAVIKPHIHLDDYPHIGEAHAENKDRQPYHLILAENAEDITIEGEGVIDGDGYSFWHKPMRELAKEGVDIDAYCNEHGLPPVYRKKNHPWYREHAKRPSPLLELIGVRGLTIRNITIANSPGWTIHGLNCDNVLIDHLTIANCLFGPNTDGLDLNGCQDVIISNCDLTCGDDAIILKSFDDARPCVRVTVSNCIISSNCAALGLGAECINGIRDVVFSGNVIRQALRAVQIEMWDAGIIENVVISGLTGTTNAPIPLQRAIYVDTQYHGRTDGKLGICRNITMSDINLTTRGRIVLTAPDGACLENITLNNINLRYPSIEDASYTVENYSSQQMSNDNPETRAVNAVVVADNVHGLVLNNLRAMYPGEGSNTQGDPEALTDLNPHNTNPPMLALCLRQCSEVVDNSPFLRPWAADGAEVPERVMQVLGQTLPENFSM